MNPCRRKLVLEYMQYALMGCLLLSPTALAQEAIDAVTIPGKTEIFVTLDRTINTKSAQIGDRFHGRVAVPITLDDQIVIPYGSYIIGFVDFAKQPGRLKGKGELRLRFDTVILPSGTTRKIRAVVQSAEEQKSKPGSEDGTLQSSGGSQAGQAGEGAAKGGATGGVIGGVSARSWKGLGVGSAIGAATGALIGVFKKGDQVVLPKGTSLTIQLESDVRFVKP